MLQSRLLLSKPEFKKKSGETIVDLTKSTYNRTKVGFDDMQIIKIDEELNMRPDLISNQAYSTILLWDALLKFNGVTNPFSIDLNTTLYVPNQKQLELGYVNSKDIIDKATKKNISQVLNIKTNIDKKRIEALQVKPLPNNVNDTTDANIKIKDGMITFGEDVTKINKERCSGSVSRAKLKEKLLQNQIFE